MRSFFDDLDLDLLARRQRTADDGVGVTVGRAAQMLRMTRQAVLKYVHAAVLRGEWIEGARRDSRQLVLRKGEVRRFRQVLEDQRRRAPRARTKQLALPLVVTAPVLRPRSWRLAKFNPVMLGAPRTVVDRQLTPPAKGKEKTRVA